MKSNCVAVRFLCKTKLVPAAAVVVLALVFSACEVVVSDLDPTASFVKYYSNGLDERPVDLYQKPDGGFLILSTSEGSGTATDIMLLSTDASGNEQWRVRYGGDALDRLPVPGQSYDVANGLLVDEATQEIYVAGAVNVGPNSLNPLLPQAVGTQNKIRGAEAILLKYSPEGTLIWNAQVSGAQAGDPNEYYMGIDAAFTTSPLAGDVVLLLLETSDDASASQEVRSFDEVTIDKATGALTTETFGTRGNGDPRLTNIVETPNGIYWVGTNVIAANGQLENYCVFAAESVGSEQENYGTDAREFCFDGVFFNGGLLMCGLRGTPGSGQPSTAFVSLGNGQDLTYNPNHPLNQPLVPYETVTGAARSVAASDFGSFVLALTLQGGPGTATDMAMAKLNDQGEELWRFEYPGSFADDAAKVVATQDGGFAMVGAYGIQNTSMIALIKVTDDGELVTE